MSRPTQPPGFSQFKARSVKTRKSCTWCGSRVSTGIVVRRGEYIAGLCCYNCYAALTSWLSQELQKVAPLAQRTAMLHNLCGIPHPIEGGEPRS